ncbi:unnamed protein product [Protopolystoma xenopodis]|uniref:Uncharacterized protein n=1 Tax=Protopolystoma xenopodis TaxID=117903 RepID=A0A3S5BBT1_9PLAT|nr:unnamed protein product [Protopolystoma xenopodis]
MTKTRFRRQGIVPLQVRPTTWKMKRTRLRRRRRGS